MYSDYPLNNIFHKITIKINVHVNLVQVYSCNLSKIKININFQKTDFLEATSRSAELVKKFAFTFNDDINQCRNCTGIYVPCQTICIFPSCILCMYVFPVFVGCWMVINTSSKRAAIPVFV